MIRTWKKIGAGMILCIFYGGMWQSERGFIWRRKSRRIPECAGDGRNGGWERLDILDVSGGSRRKCGSAGGFR